MQGSYTYRGIDISWLKDDFDHDNIWTATMGSKELCSYKSGADLEDQIDEIMKQTVKVEYVSSQESDKRWLYTGLLIGFASGMFVMFQMMN